MDQLCQDSLNKVSRPTHVGTFSFSISGWLQFIRTVGSTDHRGEMEHIGNEMVALTIDSEGRRKYGRTKKGSCRQVQSVLCLMCSRIAMNVTQHKAVNLFITL